MEKMLVITLVFGIKVIFFILNILQTGSSLGRPVWTKSGTQGNKWNPGETNIPASTTSFNIVVEGIVGPGYRGDIGLDDIQLVAGPCPNQGWLFF